MMVQADDGSWLGDAQNGLAHGPVYVSPDVPGASALQAKLQQLVPADGSIAVAVLPDQAHLESQSYPTYLLDKLFDGTHYGSVVVAMGTDLQAASRTIATDKAMGIANEAESAAGGDLPHSLTETVKAIEDAAPPASHTGADAGSAVVWMLPVGIVVVLAAAGAAVAVAARRRRRARVDRAPIPAPIADRLTRLRALRQDYARLGAQGNATAAHTAEQISSLVGTVSQLFPRLAMAGDDQRRIAQDEYADKLGRLVAALERDYLLDLLQNPQLWEDPQERIQEVVDALDAVAAQALDNVKQVNARKALHFQVSLDSLVGRDELRDWEREFKRSSGE